MEELKLLYNAREELHKIQYLCLEKLPEYLESYTQMNVHIAYERALRKANELNIAINQLDLEYKIYMTNKERSDENAE